MKANDFAHFVPAVLKQDPGAPSYGTSMVAVAQGKHRVPTGGSPMRELNWGPECFIVEQYKIEPVQTGEKSRVGDINHLSTMVTTPSRKSFATHPAMVWVQKERFMGWACSECAWEFNPTRIPSGDTLAEIKYKYERQRDKEFESHVCAEHPKKEGRA